MSSEKEPYILVFGASIYDIFGFTDDNYRTHDSNPGRVRVSFGGVCRNIAENMARIGVNTKFISVLGDDEKGKALLEHAKKIPLDMRDTIVMEGESTPTYMAVIDHYGEMVSAIVDMKITDKVTEALVDEKASIIRNAEYMIVDCDNPAIVEHIVKNYGMDTKLILDPVSAAKVEKIKSLLGKFYTIKPNRHEAEVLCGFPIKSHEDVRKAGAYFKSLGVEHVFISLDCEGMYYNNGQEEGIVNTEHASVVNVTGAGDSCVAGLGYGYMNGLSIRDMLKHAIAMSTITISHEETIHPDMCYELVKKNVEELSWSEIQF